MLSVCVNSDKIILMTLLSIMCLQIMNYTVLYCTNAQAYCIQLKYNCLNKFAHNYHSFQFRIAFTEIAPENACVCVSFWELFFGFFMVVCITLRVNSKNKMFFSEYKKITSSFANTPNLIEIGSKSSALTVFNLNDWLFHPNI